MDDNDLNDVIKESVLTAWTKKQPILLSKLGELNGGDVARNAKEKAGSLAKYLANYLNNDTIVIKHSKNPVVIGVVPRTSETEGITDFDAVLDQRSSQKLEHKIHFRKSFWAAFRRKLEPSQFRGVEVKGYNNFRNVSARDQIPEAMLEIQPEFISANDDVTDEDIYQNIIKWVQKNELLLDDFSIGGAKSSKGETSTRLPTNATTLDRLLLALDSSDLKRIEMPLDIIQKLSQSKL